MTIRTTPTHRAMRLVARYLALPLTLIAAPVLADESDGAHGWSPLEPIRSRVAIFCDPDSPRTAPSGVVVSVTEHRGDGPPPIDPAEARGIIEEIVCGDALTVRTPTDGAVPPPALNRAREEACGDSLDHHISVGGYVPYAAILPFDLNNDGRTDYFAASLCNIPASSNDLEVYIAAGDEYRLVGGAVSKHFVVLESSTLGHRDLAIGSFLLPELERTYTLLRWDDTRYQRHADITYRRPFR